MTNSLPKLGTLSRHVGHLVHLHVGHHVHLYVDLHVSHHVGHHDVDSALFEVPVTLTEWKSKSVMVGRTTDVPG